MSEKASQKKSGTPEVAQAEGEAAAPQKPSGLFGLIKAIAFVSVIVIVEVVAASMFIPSAKDTERLARQYVAAADGGSESADASEGEAAATEHKAEQNIAEVEMGTFNITHFNPATNSTLSIDFELYGAVLAENQAEFTELFEKNKVRVREQVLMTLHSAESKDLTDAGLGLIKRQILEKTNRALGHPLLKEVLFSKFNFIER